MTATPRIRAAGIPLRVVADPGREDLLEPRDLGRRRRPRAVQPLRDRVVDRLERALVHATAQRAARHDARGRVQRELLRARAGRQVVEDAVPDVVAVCDLGAAGGEAAVGRERRLVARHAQLRVGADVRHPVVHHRKRLGSRVGLPRRARVREPDHLVGRHSPSRSRMRCREANDWWLLCMSSSSSR